MSALLPYIPQYEEKGAYYMDESREAIEGGRGISLKRMLAACCRHCANSISTSNEEQPVCTRGGIVQVEAIVSCRQGIDCMAFDEVESTKVCTGDGCMLDDLILSI